MINHFRQLKLEILSKISAHCLFTMMSSFAYLVTVKTGKGFVDAVWIYISSYLFYLIYAYGKEEIEVKVSKGVISNVVYSPIVVPVLIISLGAFLAPSKVPNKYFLMASLICIGLSSQATINWISNKIILAKNNNSL